MRSAISPSQVGLEALDLDAQFGPQRQQLFIDLRQRGRAVLLRVALAEHVEVDAVENEELHGELRCAGMVGRMKKRCEG